MTAQEVELFMFWNAPLMTSVRQKIMQNTASGEYVARLNITGITSYDLINLLEHIIQSAQHLTPHLCAAAAGWAVIGRGECTMVNTTYHVAAGMTLTALSAAREAFCLFFHSADDGPAQLQPYGRHCLVTSSSHCKFRWGLRSNSCSSWNWQSYLLCCHSFPCYSVTGTDDGGAK